MSLYALDTDILSLYQRGHAVVCRNIAAHPPSELSITVITVEEQLSGWYMMLRNERRPDRLARTYQRLAECIPVLASFAILPYPETAQARYKQLLLSRLNLRKMDLRIASIALEYGATVVTRNVGDFQRIPALAVENWSL